MRFRKLRHECLRHWRWKVKKMKKKLRKKQKPRVSVAYELKPILFMGIVVCLLSVLFFFFSDLSFAQVSLPGADASDKLEAAGTLMRIVDTGLFKWGARVFAGLCIMSAGWSLKEQRFGVAVICVLGAIVFGTAPKWVKNIFDIGGNQSIFSKIESVPGRSGNTHA